MLHVYIVKTALSGNVPEGTIHFERPESESHRMWDEAVSVPYHAFDEAGWVSAWGKMHRIVSDGSGNVAGCYSKIKRLCGEGTPIGTRETRDVLASYFLKAVFKRIVKGGVKAKDVPKLGKNVAEITTSAKAHGIADGWIKKAVKHAKAQADLEAADIE